MRMGEADALEDIARLRAAPEYTMQAVAQQTGVPPDTLRSWERRYGFPEPSRTDSNRRLFSERDIAAIAWLRDQTERGQGISEAVNMLLPRLREGRERATPSATPVRHERPSSLIGHAAPIDELASALAAGAFPAAQHAWDRLALAASIESLCLDVLLPTDQALRQTVPPGPARSGASAFLLRKATVLLDHAGPDRLAPSIALVADEGDHIKAIVFAVLLARDGWGVAMPIGGLALDTLALVRTARPTKTIIVLPPDGGADRVAAFASACAGISIAVWSPGGSAIDLAGVEVLPASPLEAVAALTRDLGRDR
jgi:DNA-binding transcriptional MerR regulator